MVVIVNNQQVVKRDGDFGSVEIRQSEHFRRDMPWSSAKTVAGSWRLF